jgi:hypothetical protein
LGLYLRTITVNITIENASQFREQFQRAGRKDQFSYEALGLLFDYFEELAPDMALDVIAVCCEYAESSISELAESYDIDLDGLEGEARIEAVVEYLDNHTSIVGMVNDETIVYAQF